LDINEALNVINSIRVDNLTEEAKLKQYVEASKNYINF
jgi:hypothetical protein